MADGKRVKKMDIFGIGGWELVAIFIIMLLVAGPKRMIAWSYTLGRWVATVQKMWRTTAEQIQKELDAEGIDIKVPRDLPTRNSIRKEAGRLAQPFTKPIQDEMDAVKRDIDEVKKTTDSVRTGTVAAPAPKPAAAPAANGNGKPEDKPTGEFGSWSGGG